MIRQNVTLSLPKSLLQKAKMLAASQEKSLSQIIRESLEDKVREASGYKAARERQIKLLKQGIDLQTKGKISVTRDELHDRR